MPVDLSMIGLDGIKAGQDTLTAIETRKSMAALTQAQQLENETTQNEMALDEQAAQLMNQISSGNYKGESTLFDGVDTESSSATMLDIVGNIYMKGGAPKKGMEFLKGSTEIRKKEQEMRSAEFTDQKNKLENILKVSDFVSRTIGTARNQSEWEYGKQQLKKAGVLPPEVVEQLDQMQEFDPDVAAFFNEQALTAYQRASLDMTSANQQATQDLSQQRLQDQQQRTTIAKERLRLAEIAQNRADKGGKSAVAPDEKAIKSVSAVVTNEIFKGTAPKGEDKAAFDAGVQSIAARALAMVKEDKALDWETAVNRAVVESQSEGDWEMYAGKKGPLDFLGIEMGSEPAKTKFSSLGRNPDTAIPLPSVSDDDPTVDKAKLKKGKFYITTKGAAKWNGTAWEITKP